ncbi:MAG: SCO family protein [Acidobacteriota bacterium]|nr:SCO family protein [Acidobacteriota bacterium]
MSGLPASVSTSLAGLMALSPVPHRLAPGFTLTDQVDRTMSLGRFRGKVVVLEFMDPHCTDICPLVSQEFIDAYRDLGRASSHAAFLAVNVNQYYSSVADMAAYSHEHRLDTIPSWHFLTGSARALSVVWRSYGVAVEAPNPRADIIHTSVIYFIDRRGRERYVATPMADHSTTGAAYLPASSLASWGQGIAQVVRSLAQ